MFLAQNPYKNVDTQLFLLAGLSGDLPDCLNLSGEAVNYLCQLGR